ncbi:UbiA prenyltransferase family-domain-containing protein [Schizophyllum commune]
MSPALTAILGGNSSLSIALAALKLPYTLHLFNKTDITTTVLPIKVLYRQMGIGLALAQPTNLFAIFRGLIWLQLHLIAFEIQNQIVGLEEDRISKPFRPIVAGRISMDGANRLYNAFVVLSLVMSAWYGGITASLIHLASMTVYNQGGLASNWFLKSAIGALGTSCYCWGVALMMSAVLAAVRSDMKANHGSVDDGKPPSDTARLAITLCFFNFLTTGHAQDFRDRAGDAAIGRRTLAVILPQTSGRWLLLTLIFFWSIGLAQLWHVPAGVVLVNLSLAGACGIRMVIDYSEASDKSAYWWYNDSAQDPDWLLTPEGLAATMGLIPEKEPPNLNEDIRAGLISHQLGGLQQLPPPLRLARYCEYSAKYLPQTIEKWKANDNVMSAATNLLNEISSMPYFMRLAVQPENQDFLPLQFGRTLSAADAMDRMSARDVALILQFLSTLLVVQGPGPEDVVKGNVAFVKPPETIPQADREALIPRLRVWKRKFPGVLGGETAERCLTVLTGKGEMALMIPMVRGAVLKGVQSCAAQGCSKESSDSGPLLRCAKCRSTVYCSQQHQRAHWSQHKQRCFKVEW